MRTAARPVRRDRARTLSAHLSRGSVRAKSTYMRGCSNHIRANVAHIRRIWQINKQIWHTYEREYGTYMSEYGKYTAVARPERRERARTRSAHLSLGRVRPKSTDTCGCASPDAPNASASSLRQASCQLRQSFFSLRQASCQRRLFKTGVLSASCHLSGGADFRAKSTDTRGCSSPDAPNASTSSLSPFYHTLRVSLSVLPHGSCQLVRFTTRSDTFLVSK